MKLFNNETANSANTLTINKSPINKTPINKSAIGLLVITSLMAAPTYASSEVQHALTAQEKIEQAQTNEEIGFGTGALIGGLLGGPVGAFFTGIVGSIIAKNVNAENTIEDLELTLNQKDQHIDQTIAKYQQTMQSTEQAYQAELLSLENNYSKSAQLQAENLLMSLQFSTGSSDVQPHYQEQITALVSMLQQSPDLSIDLSGYTDLQGDEALNKALSMARVNSVKHALIDGGVESDRIQLFAYGEQEPVVANTNKEISFYDRRVVIKLHQTNQDQTAQNF
jgi:sortase system peptidoglycan-associated protein